MDFLDSVKSILKNDGLDIYEKMVWVIVKTFESEYKEAYPSYETIAELGSMSKRKAQYVIKDLCEKKIIDKKSRFKTKEDQQVQITNTYTTDAQHAPVEKDCAQDASYNAFKKDLTTEDDNNIYIPPQYKLFRQIYKDMIERQGGALSFNDQEFLDCCIEHSVTNTMAENIYETVKGKIGRFCFESIRKTFELFARYLKRGRIAFPARWFASTYFNENLKFRSGIM